MWHYASRRRGGKYSIPISAGNIHVYRPVSIHFVHNSGISGLDMCAKVVVVVWGGGGLGGVFFYPQSIVSFLGQKI